MLRATLDTNILVSIFAKPTGVTASIYTLWREGKFELVISDYILAELGKVLIYKLGLDRHFVSDRLGEFYSLAWVVEPLDVGTIESIQQKDLPIIGTAVAGSANVLVTGDKAVLKLKNFQNVQILSSRQFLSKLK